MNWFSRSRGVAGSGATALGSGVGDGAMLWCDCSSITDCRIALNFGLVGGRQFSGGVANVAGLRNDELVYDDSRGDADFVERGVERVLESRVRRGRCGRAG